MQIGPVQFGAPEWLLLLPPLVAATLWIGRRSLAYPGPSHRLAVAVRLFVVLALVGALAEPSWRERAEDVAVTLILDTSRSVPSPAQARAREWAAEAGVGRRGDDALGFVTVAREAIVQQLASRGHRASEITAPVGPTDGTNLAQGVQIGLAIAPSGAANRLVLVSDGNETEGNLLGAARQAAAARIPIDVAPTRFVHGAEVLVERVVAPATARVGETINVRVFIRATAPTGGRLSLLRNGSPEDLDPGSPGTSMRVELAAGLNPLTVPIPDPGPGRQEFRAIYEPDIRAGVPVGDTIIENNVGLATTFVAGRGRVLVVGDAPESIEDLLRVLSRARIEAEVRSPHSAFDDLADLAGFQGVILVNQSAYDYTHAQQESLRRYIHDAGGGLVMIGGPDTFGAGGWIGSPLEDALPVRLDPPQRRNTPRGAMMIVVDVSGSMAAPVGSTGKSQLELASTAAIASLNALTPRDLVGVITFESSHRVLVPLQENTDRARISRAILSMAPGGGTNMFPAIRAAGRALAAAEACVKHIVVLSDGQTVGSPADGAEIARLLGAAGITVSTVAIGDGADRAVLARIASLTRGRFYPVDSGNVERDLPAIFVRESSYVARSLVWEGDPFAPTVTGAGSEPMRGIGSVPPIGGYIVAGDREGLSMVTLRGGAENDPIAAHWQYGLGRVVAFLSDAGPRWATPWVGWGGFTPFWEQHVRWMMPPDGSADVRMTTEHDGDRTIVAIDARTPEGEPLNFATFNVRVSGPEGPAVTVPLRQAGPGRYLGEFIARDPGTYLVSAAYEAIGPSGAALSGNVRGAVVQQHAVEFRSLTDNAPLLLEVARLTGGRTLDILRPGADANLWARHDLAFPVATTPFWLAMALAGLGLFLADVGVRRVRIDPLAMLALVRPGKGAVRSAELGVLHEAKRRSRAALAQAQPPIATFEAAPGASTDLPVVDVSEIRPADPPAPPRQPAAEPQQQGDAMSRLMRAKRGALPRGDDPA